MGVYIENLICWMLWFRSVVGVCVDFYCFNVKSDNVVNLGWVIVSIVNFKFVLIFGLWSDMEFYVNVGDGFYSNDVCGMMLMFDFKIGNLVDKVFVLVCFKGFEFGVCILLLLGL